MLFTWKKLQNILIYLKSFARFLIKKALQISVYLATQFERLADFVRPLGRNVCKDLEKVLRNYLLNSVKKSVKAQL